MEARWRLHGIALTDGQRAGGQAGQCQPDDAVVPLRVGRLILLAFQAVPDHVQAQAQQQGKGDSVTPGVEAVRATLADQQDGYGIHG